MHIDYVMMYFMYEADKFASVASVFDFWRNEVLELSAAHFFFNRL